MFRYFLLGFFSVVFFSASAQNDSLYYKALGFYHYQQYDSSTYYLLQIIQPESPQYLSALAASLMQQGNYKEAVSSYLHLLSLDNRQKATIYYQLAQLYALMNDSNALVYLKKTIAQPLHVPLIIIQQNPYFSHFKNTASWNNIFNNNEESPLQNSINQVAYDTSYHHYASAIETIDSYLKEHPKESYLYHLEGLILEQQHDTSGALSYFKQAFELNKNNEQYRLRYARSLIYNKKYKKAISVLSYFQTHKATQAIYLKWLGLSYFKLKKWSPAIENLHRYSLFFYGDAETFFMLSQAYLKVGKRQDALLAINNAIRCNPKSRFSYMKFRGLLYIKMKIYRMALPDLKNALDIHPNDGESYFYLGLAFHGMNNQESACQAWEKAVDLHFMKANQYRLKYCSH